MPRNSSDIVTHGACGRFVARGVAGDNILM